MTDLPTIYRLASRAAEASPPPDWPDRLLGLLNPEHLPPALTAADPHWHAPWQLVATDPASLPRGWADEMLTSERPDAERAGLLALALAAATARGEDGLYDSGWKASETAELLALGLRRLWEAGGRVDLEPRVPEPWAAPSARRLRDRFRSVSTDWRRDNEPDCWSEFHFGRDWVPLEVALNDGRRFEVGHDDWVASDVGVPSVCPLAHTHPPAFQVGGRDFLTHLERELRQSGRLHPHQSVHWLGGGGGCECRVVRPGGGVGSASVGLEVDLFRAAGELLAAVRKRSGRRLTDGEWADVRRAGDIAARQAAALGRKPDHSPLGECPAGGEWFGPALVPVRKTTAGVELLRVSGWEERWAGVQDGAADRLRRGGESMIPRANLFLGEESDAEEEEEVQPTPVPLPEADATGAAHAVRTVLEAAAAVEAYREDPKGPTVWFESWRGECLAEAADQPEPKPRGRKKGAKVVEQNTRRDEPVSPGAAAPADATDDPLGPDETCDPNEPNVDPLVEQALGVIVTVRRAWAAVHAAEDELAATAMAGGCAVRSVLEGVTPALELCERVLGLTPFNPRSHLPAWVNLGGVRYAVEPVVVTPEGVEADARRVPVVSAELLAAASLQGTRAGDTTADDRSDLRRPNRPASGYTRQEVDSIMFGLVHHPDEERRAYYQQLSREGWAKLLDVTQDRIRKTNTWKGLEYSSGMAERELRAGGHIRRNGERLLRSELPSRGDGDAE